MKTLEQKLQELEQKIADERAALQAKFAVLAQLPPLEGYAPPLIHSHKLYGSVGSMNFSTQKYASTSEGKNPDSNLLRLLLAAAPPVDLVKYKSGCISFRPEPETYENNGEYTDVDPVLITIHPSQYSQKMRVEWYGMLGGNIWRMSCEFPLPPDHLIFLASLLAGGRTDSGSFTIYWERGHNVDVPALFELLPVLYE